MPLKIGVITCSDSTLAGEREDTSGQALVSLSQERGWEVVAYDVCADEQECIADSIMRLADLEEADIILTTGGTGLSPRDVTPEATLAVCDREAPGIAEHIRAQSAKVTGRAMLSRGRAGQRGTTLVINLPGSEKAVRESFAFIAEQLEHAVEMMGGGGH